MVLPGSDYLDGRLTLITSIRDAASSHFGAAPAWDVEYLVPLFLVAFGLLTHARSCDNLIAARLFVLTLARLIEARILPGLATQT